MSNLNSKKIFSLLVFVSAVLIVLLVILFVDPIAQNPDYHNFIDDKTMMGVPHFWNVISNTPFFVVGLWGLIKLDGMSYLKKFRHAYQLWFFGVMAVALGSGYYHLQPQNNTLVWDRLPMTMAFMSLFAIIIAEFVNEKRGVILLWPFLVIGIFSVFYWQWTETQSVGDLRPYAIVQFLPMVIIPVILLLFKGCFTHKSGYWWLLFYYFLAKLLEYYDAGIYEVTGHIMSGHALKHMSAAFGVWMLLNSYSKRSVNPDISSQNVI